ncbi:MAG: hypothetical protein ACO3EZ_05975 [Prochlorotrichaceae cyanobacterium]
MPTETEQRILDAIEGVRSDVNALKGDVSALKEEMTLMQSDAQKRDDRLTHLEKTVDKIDRDGERFNDRFLNYQSSIDRLINLSTSLIASATIAVIVGMILFIVKK